MPSAGSGHWSVWKAAGDERSDARSGAPQNRIARARNAEAIEALEQGAEETNAILHVTCSVYADSL